VLVAATMPGGEPSPAKSTIASSANAVVAAASTPATSWLRRDHEPTATATTAVEATSAYTL
jgi:hypothetical protein